MKRFKNILFIADREDGLQAGAWSVRFLSPKPTRLA